MPLADMVTITLSILCRSANSFARSWISSNDSYHSFRSQLVSFVNFLKTGERAYPWSETVELMKLVIAGIESREQGGKEIRIW